MSVYAPNTFDPVFFDAIKTKLLTLDDIPISISADFNLVADSMDRSGLCSPNQITVYI